VLSITQKIAKKSRIIFLSNEKNRNEFELIRKSIEVPGASIDFVAIESIPESTFTKKFRSNSSLDRTFRDGFWFNASNRFLVIADYISHSGIKNIIHIENDYVLYFDPTDKIEAFNSFADFAVPLDKIRAIPGIVWFKDGKVANSLAQYISENSYQDDMKALGEFCLQGSISTSKPLPTIPSEYAKANGLYNQRYADGIDLFGGVFDAAAIGQYVGGVHWMNNPTDTTFFINESSALIMKDFTFSWAIKDGIKMPLLIRDGKVTKVLGLHAHSKNLEAVSPFNHGVPEDEEGVVTGERLQSFCEITIGAPSITKFHGRENIQSKELLEIPEDNQGNLALPSFDLIERVSRAESIFVYTHLIPYFTYYLAPRIKSEFTLVTHNSDHPVTIMDYQLLNHPHLKEWFAQNCEFSHTKLKPLPLGVQNKQWGPTKISQLVNTSKDIFKIGMVYANFSVDTHPSRAVALEVAKELPYVTVEAGVDYNAYLQSLARHKFCICPRGNGIDTHRFWEAQYLDCIPIILWLDWTASYSELPVLILDSWQELKELDLEAIYIALTNKKYLRTSLDLRKIAKKINHG
jgi:hypothetical protein